MIRRLICILGMLLMAGVVACDKDDGPEKQISGGNNGGEADAGDTQDDEDTGDDDMDAESDTETGDTGDTREDEDTNTPDEDAGDTDEESDTGEQGDTFEGIDTDRGDGGPGVSGSCEDIEDLGMLAFGPQERSFRFDVDNDFLRTSCRDLDSDTKPEKVYQFQVAKRGVLELDGSPNYTFEVRTDPCGQESSVETCNPSGNVSGFSVVPETEYFLIVEFEGEVTDTADFPFEMTLESILTECGPNQTQCADASTVRVCNSQGSYEEFACPTSTCTSGSSGAAGACEGDTCENPIQVSAGSASMNGNIAAYSNKLDAYDSSCSGSGSSGGIGSDPFLSGQEVVFSASQLLPGQSITVASSGTDVTHTVAIQRDTCGSGVPCEFFELNDSSPLTYQVQSAGDYYIVIDSAAGASGTADFNVQVTN